MPSATPRTSSTTRPPRTSAPPKARAIPIGDVPPPEDPPPLLSVPAAAATVPSRLGPAYVGSAGSVGGSIAESVGLGLVPLDLLGLGDTLGDGLPDGSGWSIRKKVPTIPPPSGTAVTLWSPGWRSSGGGLNDDVAMQLMSVAFFTAWPSQLTVWAIRLRIWAVRLCCGYCTVITVLGGPAWGSTETWPDGRGPAWAGVASMAVAKLPTNATRPAVSARRTRIRQTPQAGPTGGRSAPAMVLGTRRSEQARRLGGPDPAQSGARVPPAHRSARRSRSSRATSAHSGSPAGAPGSRSMTSRSGPGAPTFHWGTCSSSAARLASQTIVGRSSATTKSSVSRSFVEPGTGSVSMRTQAGTPSGAFFSKKLLPATPLGYRFRVNARSSMCGRSTGDTRV